MDILDVKSILENEFNKYEDLHINGPYHNHKQMGVFEAWIDTAVSFAIDSREIVNAADAESLVRTRLIEALDSVRLFLGDTIRRLESENDLKKEELS